MKNFKFYMSVLAVSALLFTSCSKDDPGTDTKPGEEQMVALSFKGALEQYDKAMATKQQTATLPECNENAVPDHVKVGIKDDSGAWITDDYISIDVISPASDSDADGAANNLTVESSDLELEAGDYTLEYFGVFNDEDELIWLAPRGDEDYGPANFGNFVADALPISIDLVVGTKHYVEVEVLCYDEAEARQYGYLFFDFEEVPLTYLCVFGNECDIDGRHTPSHFRVKIWEYPTVDGSEVAFTDANALVNETNEVRTLESGLLQADPLCFPLPDRDGENMFYGEIYTIDSEGNETLIRRGDFTDEDTKSEEFNIDNNQNLRNYWHFREGPFCGEDSSPCLLSDVVQDWDQDFESGELLAGTATDYIDVDTNNDGIYDDNDADQGTAPFGGYLITDNAKNYYGGFTSQSYMGNMIVFDGSPDDRERVYYTVETPTLCEGDVYYLKMDVRDISSPDVNNAYLKVNFRSGTPEAGQTVAHFKIDPLTDNGSGVAGWKTVGIKVVATDDGQMLIRIRDSEENNTGNDFALDNVIMSNDPTILNGVPSGNINPNN